MYCTLCLSFCSFGYDFYAFGTSSRWMISQPSLPCPINNIINNFSRTFWPPTIPCISSPDVPVSNCGVRSPNCVYTQQLGDWIPQLRGPILPERGIRLGGFDPAIGSIPLSFTLAVLQTSIPLADFDPPRIPLFGSSVNGVTERDRCRQINRQTDGEPESKRQTVKQRGTATDKHQNWVKPRPHWT